MCALERVRACVWRGRLEDAEAQEQAEGLEGADRPQDPDGAQPHLPAAIIKNGIRIKTDISPLVRRIRTALSPAGRPARGASLPARREAPRARVSGGGRLGLGWGEGRVDDGRTGIPRPGRPPLSRPASAPGRSVCQLILTNRWG